MLKPKLFTIMESGYSREQFAKDVSGGLIAGIIAIPLSIALAIASGVSPEKGLYTAIIAGLIVSLLGGSRVQIGGPTAALILITYSIIDEKGYPALVLATIMAGIILILMGLLKMGSVFKFIPYPITTGFTSGIAVLIFFQQIKAFLGLKTGKLPSRFVPMLTTYIKSIDTFSISSLIIGIIALLIIIGWPYIYRRIPSFLVAIIITTGLVRFLGINVATIGDQFESLNVLPSFTLPRFNLSEVIDLLPEALTIAVLIGIEAILSAVVADGMVGDTHEPNVEIVAHGTANIISALFGGLPATGAVHRTAANVRNGGRTPISGIVHSVCVFVVMLLFMPLVRFIPLSALAAILMVIAFNMDAWNAFKSLFKAPKTDIAVFIVTFILTLLADLVVTIELCIIMSAFLFMKQMSDVTRIESIKAELEDRHDIVLNNPEGINPSIQIFQVYGPFFYGAADKFTSTVQQNISRTHVMIIQMNNVPFMDETGYHSLFKTYSFCRSRRILLLFTHVNMQPISVMEKHGFIELVGKDNFCPDIENAIERANAYIELQSKYNYRKVDKTA